MGKVPHACQEVRSPSSYCPRSSLPAAVLAWLAAAVVGHIATATTDGHSIHQ